MEASLDLKSSRRFLFIDGLRGLAALAVVVPHSTGLLIHANANSVAPFVLRLAPYFSQGVQVFFVISGFAIAYSLRDTEKNGTLSVSRFIVRRSIRLDPPYWAGLILFAVVEAMRALANHQPIPIPHVAKILAHLFYLQDLLGYGQYNVAFWTLCLEFQFYLVFALLVRLLATLYGKSTAAVAERRTSGTLLVVFIAFFIASHTLRPMNGWFVSHFYVFLSGVLACWLTLGRISDVSFVSCLGLMLLGCVLHATPQTIVAAATASVVYSAIRMNALNVWLRRALFQRLGKISYSIYLVHIPIVTGVSGLRVRLHNDSNIVSIAAFVSAYALTIALSLVFYVAIELPCLRASRRLNDSLVSRAVARISAD